MISRSLAIVVGFLVLAMPATVPAQVQPPASPPAAAPGAAQPAPAQRPPIRDVTPRSGGAPAPAPAAGAPSPPASPAPPAPRRAAAPVSVEIRTDNADLGERVAKTRERLIEAAQTGDIEKLAVVFQMNETMPVFTRGGERDPIAFWKQVSGDGEGREILAILLNILDQPPAVINKGTPQEMTVWPYLAHVPLNTLTPPQTVDLYRLMTAQDVRDMQILNAWVFWRLGIGPDGTLHYFLAGE